MKSPPDALVRHSLLRLLKAGPAQEEKLLADVDELGKEGAPYSSILAILTHLDFSEPEAQRHWRRIRAHRQSLREELGRDVGLRVALLDYFVNVSRELKNPKVIEISIYERTARSAVTDGLTGLYNHAYFLQALKREVLRAKRHDLLLSLIMVDLDDFKKLNDTRGHLEGDRVLLKTAGLITESLREIDIAARYGGEEFAVILPETSRTGAYVVADRIRKRIEDHFGRRRSSAPVTLSGGVACYPEDAANTEELIRRADEGLYRSKADGKNRITLVGRERRRYRRMPLDQRVTVSADGAPRRQAISKNVSEGGLLLSVRRPIAVGSRVSVWLHAAGNPPMSLRGEVVRLTRMLTAADRYDVGLRLLGSAAEVRDLLVLRRVESAAARA